MSRMSLQVLYTKTIYENNEAESTLGNARRLLMPPTMAPSALINTSESLPVSLGAVGSIVRVIPPSVPQSEK